MFLLKLKINYILPKKIKEKKRNNHLKCLVMLNDLFKLLTHYNVNGSKLII